MLFIFFLQIKLIFIQTRIGTSSITLKHGPYLIESFSSQVTPHLQNGEHVQTSLIIEGSHQTITSSIDHIESTTSHPAHHHPTTKNKELHNSIILSLETKTESRIISYLDGTTPLNSLHLEEESNTVFQQKTKQPTFDAWK